MSTGQHFPTARARDEALHGGVPFTMKFVRARMDRRNAARRRPDKSKRVT